VVEIAKEEQEMIHPSTMAGNNWTTGSFGTTNPFQQSSMPFLRTMSFPGPQATFGPGSIPFQNHPFGTNTMQMQDTINEIVRQTIPRVLANCGIPTSFGVPTPFGFQTPIGQQGQFGFQTPFAFQTPTQFGTPFQTTPWMNPNPGYGDWQTQNMLQEVVRQATIQAVQNAYQQNPYQLSQGFQSPTQPILGPQSFYGGPWQQQQSLNNLIGQVCQAVAASVIECLSQPNQIQNPLYSMGTTPFLTQQTPFFGSQAPLNMGSTAPSYGVTSGIPAGAGAF
jgi:hypothetical protein